MKIQEESIVHYMSYYNQFLDDDVMQRPPGPPCRFVSEGWFDNSKKLNKIVQSNYENQKKAYDYYVSAFKLNKAINTFRKYADTCIKEKERIDNIETAFELNNLIKRYEDLTNPNNSELSNEIYKIHTMILNLTLKIERLEKQINERC